MSIMVLTIKKKKQLMSTLNFTFLDILPTDMKQRDLYGNYGIDKNVSPIFGLFCVRLLKKATFYIFINWL